MTLFSFPTDAKTDKMRRANDTDILAELQMKREEPRTRSIGTQADNDFSISSDDDEITEITNIVVAEEKHCDARVPTTPTATHDDDDDYESIAEYSDEENEDHDDRGLNEKKSNEKPLTDKSLLFSLMLLAWQGQLNC